MLIHSIFLFILGLVKKHWIYPNNNKEEYQARFFITLILSTNILEKRITYDAVMKVTTLFGHNSSGGVGGIMNSSGGGTDKGNKGHTKIESMNQTGFVPVKASPTPTGGSSLMPGAPPAVERASSEVLYSSITPRYVC